MGSRLWLLALLRGTAAAEAAGGASVVLLPGVSLSLQREWVARWLIGKEGAAQAARRAMEHGVRKVDVQVKGPGSGRETRGAFAVHCGAKVSGATMLARWPGSRSRGARAQEQLD